MTGKEIFYKHLDKRNYSGSKADIYAQLLFTIFLHINSEIFPLLEQAEKTGKKLAIIEYENLHCEIMVTDIIFV